LRGLGVTAGLTLADETIQDDAQGRVVLHRKPVGVVGSITPWNWPLLIATWHIMAGAAGGVYGGHQAVGRIRLYRHCA